MIQALILILMILGNFLIGEHFPFSPVAMFSENRPYDTYYFVTNLQGKPIPLKDHFRESSNNLKKVYRTAWRKKMLEQERKSGKMTRKELFEFEWSHYKVKGFLPFDQATSFEVLEKLIREGDKDRILTQKGYQLRRGVVFLENQKIQRLDYVLSEKKL